MVKSKLYSKSMSEGINAQEVGVTQYSADVIDSTKQDIKRMDIATRKILTMNGELHPRSNIEMLYLKRYKGRRGLLSVEKCVLAETKGLSEYIRAQEEAMLKEVRRENILSAEETKEEYQKKNA